MRVLVVGSGGREHALAWALSRGDDLSELHAAPGNPGIAALAHCHPARADDPAALVSLARELRIDLVVVGPEAPLVAGLADELRHRGIAVFGPGAEAARIEGSKAFAKDVLDKAAVPSASSSSWPGVRIVTATGRPLIRISSGSSTATRSGSVVPTGSRRTSTAAAE